MADSGLQVPFLRRALVKALMLPGFAKAVSALTDTHATIFMLHRFSVPELRVHGHDLAALRQNLAYLRKQGYDLISLKEMFRRFREGGSLKRTIAFTIDDGYFDHARVAAPLFAEFDCPVTTFVTTGFLDGRTWFWWDKLTYIFERTKRTELRARLGNQEIPCRLDLEPSTDICIKLSELCKDVSDADRVACIEGLSRDAEVELPEAPPPQFAPLTWDEARKVERLGMTFGPHTVTHPVLSTTPDAQAEFEITESWTRLGAELSQPVPVFCYPNGRLRDFGEREMRVVRNLGLWGAVIGLPGQLAPAQFRDSENAPFLMPRFWYDDTLSRMMQCVSGMEVLKSRLRGASA
jgi:peptidoglycan/xylan/chitin deacetylase (PgdA/CDA1 family)